jgi:ABC-2 type transport system ATP-binding protein
LVNESTDPVRQVLLAEGISQSYGPRQALTSLSFSLGAGRVLGFLGPNGAGKTTAIRILTTIMEPTEGRFFVDGIGSEQPNTIRSKIGVLPESLGFPKSNTALEYLTYFGRLYGRTTADSRSRAATLLETVGLKERQRSLVGSFSRGMRQRLGIARTLVNDPVVVFLDEPTLGLDPKGQHDLLVLIRSIARERNTGVVLCSHLLSDIEEVCDDVIILSSGRMIASGSVEDVIGQAKGPGAGRTRIRIQVPAAGRDRAMQALQSVNGVTKVSTAGADGSWIAVDMLESTNGETAAQHVNNRLLEALIRVDVTVLQFQTEGGRVQEAFLHLTQGVIR